MNTHDDAHGLEARPQIPVRQEVTTPPAADALSRRTALKAFSAAAFFAATGCGARKPERKIVSLAETPEYQKPGKALWYATTYTEGHWPYGLKVKAVEGRPIKVEGLPGHPLNDGTSDVRMQSMLTSLYDPDRLRGPRKDGQDVTWEEADREIRQALDGASSIVLITGANLGPSERKLVADFTQARRGTQHFVVDGLADYGRRKAWAEIYGGDGIPVPDLAKAKVILSLGSDFLGTDGPVLANTAAFAARRTVDGDPLAENLSRLWVAEPAMTITGSNADHRIPIAPKDAGLFIEAIRKAVGGDAAVLMRAAKELGLELEVLRALAKDLHDHEGEAVVLVGPGFDAGVYGAVALLNQVLGTRRSGALRWNAEPPTLPAGDPRDVTAALQAGPDVVIVLGVNPVHDFPGGGFGALLSKAKLTVGHGLTENETLVACQVALPSAHAFESWNDARPAPGVTGIAQPLIAPLFDARQEAQSLLNWTTGAAAGNWHDYVQTQIGLAGGDWWNALRRGRVGEPTWGKPPSLQAGSVRGASGTKGRAGLEAVVALHPYVLDGRFTNRSWLLELPDPVTRTVWDNAAWIGPATAKTLGVAEGDVVKVTVGERSVEAPILVQPGTAPDCVVLPLGFGRTAGAGAGIGVGFNAAPLKGARGVAKVEKTARTHKLVRMQETFSQQHRPIARVGTADEYRKHPDFAQHMVHVPEPSQLHDEWDYSKGHKWAMSIDLNACTGCSACTIACQSENNIPVVGKEECSLGREMSWIRVDRYETGDEANPEVTQQPMLCQHCDNAPCESVCPVNATAHSPEGLNEQVYNRCVGTRYCGNNCPYKVRRFNFYAYVENDLKDSTQELLSNPNVTVRSRGVMEKCTFCVQRINAARFEAANKGEAVPDGAVAPACQQACPAHAIVFGDVNTEGSEISKKRASPLAYHVLEELNVRPNVAYLAKVRNPHPSLQADSHTDEGGHR